MGPFFFYRVSQRYWLALWPSEAGALVVLGGELALGALDVSAAGGEAGGTVAAGGALSTGAGFAGAVAGDGTLGAAEAICVFLDGDALGPLRGTGASLATFFAGASLTLFAGSDFVTTATLSAGASGVGAAVGCAASGSGCEGAALRVVVVAGFLGESTI